MKLTDILARDVTAVMLASVLALPARSYEFPRAVSPAVPSLEGQHFMDICARSTLPEATHTSVRVPMHLPTLTVSSAINSVVTYTLPAFAPSASMYSPSTPVRYEKRSEDYVHVPSWVTVSRAPLTQFGSSLFGLAIPSTGSVYVREDLEGKEFTEVLFHEVLHNLYPACSESEIRSMVLARFGADAPIHTHVCRPGAC